MSTASRTMAFAPPANLKGVFVGSGSDGMADPRIATTILDLVDTKLPQDIRVLYLGTATYDLPYFQTRQTQCFIDLGCQVESLELMDNQKLSTTTDIAKKMIERADVFVVGGGNTLFAVDRWTQLGIIPHLQKAMEQRGAILTGGSAGAICWFDGGHSDSMDPDTYKGSMLERFGNTSTTTLMAAVVDESSAAPSDENNEEKKDWKYIRVPGLGFLPGLLCPHHDRIQSNGVLRAHDFDQMLLSLEEENKSRGSTELGIGIDHWAALIVEGNDYRVLSLEGKPGSVLIGNSSSGEEEATLSPQAEGVPGIWIKQVVDGKVQARLCPSKGKLSDLLWRRTMTSTDEQEIGSCPYDEDLERCRRANPSGDDRQSPPN